MPPRFIYMHSHNSPLAVFYLLHTVYYLLTTSKVVLHTFCFAPHSLGKKLCVEPLAHILAGIIFAPVYSRLLTINYQPTTN